MRIADFKENHQTQEFVTWFSHRIDGTAAIAFKYQPELLYSTLSDAREAYSWPPRATTIPTPNGDLSLRANSSLAENTKVLDQLRTGLRTSFANDELGQGVLADWVEAVLRWGGVYSRQRDKGNAGWLDNRRNSEDLWVTLKDAMAAFTAGKIHSGEGVSGLRSNAGLTKVYSLLLDDFIIYDSRVAGALAWLVMTWGQETGDIPHHLRFICMQANEGKSVEATRRKVRRPDNSMFPQLQSSNIRAHQKHAMWNLRANHLLVAALAQAQQRQSSLATAGFRTVRDVEAALFVMGYDLRHALT